MIFQHRIKTQQSNNIELASNLQLDQPVSMCNQTEYLFQSIVKCLAVFFFSFSFFVLFCAVTVTKIENEINKSYKFYPRLLINALAKDEKHESTSY